MKLESIETQLKDRKIHWHYKAYLVSLYHHIKQVQEGESRSGRAKIGWSIRDTARALHISVGTIHNHLKLAAALQIHPELKDLPIKSALKQI
jgi:hypothetical protein